MATRALARTAAAIAILATCLAVAPTATAQQPTVTIRLIGQTPWTSARHQTLTITFAATNSGAQAIGDLSAGLTLGPAVRARLTYEQTLVSGPGPFPIYAATVPQGGFLAPGQTRRFTVAVDISQVRDVSRADSLVYPAQVGLLSAGAPVATANTAEINFIRSQEQPLRVAWWAEVTAPVAMAPSGLLSDPHLETSIAPRGALRSEVSALRRLAAGARSPSIRMVVEPALLDELSRMADDGYGRTFAPPVNRGKGGAVDAAKVLADLRTAAGAKRTEVSAMPFSAPALPSLMGNGLTHDLDRQDSLGEHTVTRWLGAPVDPLVVRPPGGLLDEAAVQALASRGVTTILGDADTVPRPPQPNDFSPPPTALLPARGGGGVSVVLPDPNVAALLANEALLSDPVRAAQAVLGEIATIWRENPSTVRGIAVGLPTTLPAALWDPLLQRLGLAPFLQTVQPSTLGATVGSVGAPAALSHPSFAGFTRSYVAAIRTARDEVAAYELMLTGPSPMPDRLDRNLFFAEAGQYVGDEAGGRGWIDQVQGFVGGVFARVGPDTSQTFTFTSHAGKIPIRMGDPGPIPLRIVVQLRSSRFSFPNGDTQRVTLTRRNQIVEFSVHATASGQGAIQVIVRAPTGRVIDQGTLLVRSTAVSRIALIITAAAALVLGALWSRRFFRRPIS